MTKDLAILIDKNHDYRSTDEFLDDIDRELKARM
jgi:isocitrate dehydrogenase